MSNNFLKRVFVRNLEADNLLEALLVSAVSSMLIVRFLLFILDYPQLGGSGLHVAHVLLGGLLMLLALILLFSFITKPSQMVAAIIGGIGFGVFIDELGKFITSDNNYFFQPTIALIYVIFILLFLAFRALGKARFITKTEYLINALEISKEAILNDLDEEEKVKALYFLKRSGQQNGLTSAFSETFARAELVAQKHNLIVKTAQKIKKFYLNIAGKDWFIKGLVVIFTFQSFVLVGNAILVGKSFLLPSLATISLPQKLELFSSIIASFFSFAGILQLRRNRIGAYRLFKNSLLISIFLTQFFAFYDQQLLALGELVPNVALLTALNYTISLEKTDLTS